jgi:hypothetical protein
VCKRSWTLNLSGTSGDERNVHTSRVNQHPV